MPKNLVYRIILGFITFSLGQVAFANTYRVELIVFAHSMPHSEWFDQTSSSIKWPTPLLEIAAPAATNPNAVVMMPLAGLSSTYALLAQQQHYKMLLQTAWLQTLNYNQWSQAVHFNAPGNIVNGFINIMANASLNIQLDAEYLSEKKMGAKNIIYRLTERRVLKPEQIHYFDHPAFGIITLITQIS